MTPNGLYFLQEKNEVRVSRLVKLKTHDKKKARNQHKYDKLVVESKIARKERIRRAGTHKRGMNLDGGEEEQPSKKEKKGTSLPPSVLWAEGALCNTQQELQSKSGNTETKWARACMCNGCCHGC